MKLVLLCSNGTGNADAVMLRKDYRRRTKLSWDTVDTSGVELVEYWDVSGDIEAAGLEAISESLDGHEFGIVAFDDMLVAPDILDYFRWAEEVGRDDPNVVTIGAWTTSRPETTDTYYEVIKDQCYHCGVFGTWRDTWFDRMLPLYPPSVQGMRGVDQQFTDVIYPQEGWYELRPTWSRCQTIGAFGEHMRPNMLEAHSAKPWAAEAVPPEGIRPWHMRGDE